MIAHITKILFVSCCFLLLLCMPAFSTQQHGGSSGAGSPTPQASDQVKLIVTVTDASGRVIEGLARDNFTVLLENSLQSLIRFSAEDEPTSVVLLFDLSGSMSLTQQSKISRVSLVAAPLQHFLQLAHPSNEYAVMHFSDTTSVVLNWTRDRSEVLKTAAALGTEKLQGSTALRHACQLAAEHAKTGVHSKSAVIFFSDGWDNPESRKATSVSPNELKQFLRSAGVLFYGVNLGSIPFSLEDASRNRLDGRPQETFQSICLMTGGSDFHPKLRADLIPILETIATALRHQYTLGFSPSPPLLSGKFYKVKVKLLSQPGARLKTKGLSVRHRDGIQAQ